MTTQLQMAIHTAQQLSPVEQLELIKTVSQFLQVNGLPAATQPPPRRPQTELVVEARPTEDVEPQKQIYLQRVNQLYINIQDWLRNEPLVVTHSDLEIEEVLGRYHVPKLTIATDQGERLADFEPAGASVIGAEGLIMANGWLDSAYLLYLQTGGLYTGKSKEIKTDGWYWQEQSINTPLHLLDKEWLLKVITWVSDHEFH
jgi:hypothetical protein